MRNTAKKGFTLVELLVVIAIIAVLATIILPGMGKIRAKAQNLKCQSNLRALYMGMVQYEGDFKSFPRGGSYRGKDFWNVLRLLPTVPTSIFKDKNNEKFMCPIKGGQPAMDLCDYRGPNFDVSYALDESDPVGSDKPSNHDPKKSQKDMNVLYWGGQIQGLDYTANNEEWGTVESQLQD